MPNGMVHLQVAPTMMKMKKAAHGMTHAQKVAKCMKANPGMSLAAASKKVASMKK
jgi:hypothetical protein